MPHALSLLLLFYAGALALPADADGNPSSLGGLRRALPDCGLLITMNHAKKPFDDRRVRRALTLALESDDAHALSEITRAKDAGGVAEARRLLREAGVPAGFAFTVKNRAVPTTYGSLTVWLTDQWRRIGLNVKREVMEAAAYFAALRDGNFEVAVDFQCRHFVEAALDESPVTPRYLRLE